MFKKSDGKLGFSFNRLINNAVPNFASDGADDVDLTPEQKDGLFQYQLGEQDPKVLGPNAFYMARLVGSEKTSREILRDLEHNGCINKTTGLVDTTKITSKFANQVPHIDVHTQRKLISTLFFWEEEVNRWRLMDNEEAEIQKQKASSTDPTTQEQLTGALKMLQENRRLKPSERTESGAKIGEGEEELPSYS